MRDKKKVLLMFVLVLLLSCVGCHGHEEIRETNEETIVEVTVSPDDDTCFNLVNNIVSETELLNFLDTWPNAKELNEKYPIECFRHGIDIPIWGELIWATYRTDKGWVLVYFHEDMEYNAYRSTQMESKTKALDKVKVGMSVDEVEELDPAGDYWFRYSNMRWVSYHYTEEGTEYFIAYDGYFNVTEIGQVLI